MPVLILTLLEGLNPVIGNTHGHTVVETDAAVLELDCQPRHAAHLFGNGDGMGVHLMYKFVGKCQVDNGIRILIPVIIIPIS